MPRPPPLRLSPRPTRERSCHQSLSPPSAVQRGGPGSAPARLPLSPPSTFRRRWHSPPRFPSRTCVHETLTGINKRPIHHFPPLNTVARLSLNPTTPPPRSTRGRASRSTSRPPVCRNSAADQRESPSRRHPSQSRTVTPTSARRWGRWWGVGASIALHPDHLTEPARCHSGSQIERDGARMEHMSGPVRVSLPETSLCDALLALGPLPTGVELVEWDFTEPPPVSNIDIVVPPYMGSESVYGALAQVTARLVQSQSIGYDDVAGALPPGHGVGKPGMGGGGWNRRDRPRAGACGAARHPRFCQGRRRETVGTAVARGPC